MQRIHYISLFTAIGLIALLYWGVNTIPPKKAPVSAAASEPREHQEGDQHDMPEPASTDSIITASRQALPAHAVEELSVNEKKIAALQDSAAMVPLFEEQSKLWQEHKMFPMAAIIKSRAAHLAHSEKNLNFAGQFYMDLAQQSDQPPIRLWAAQQAIGCYNEALSINPDNDTIKLALASGYIDGTGEVMKGVGILREMTAKDPNHVPANMVLGSMSIRSGQFDKAIGRFETVLKQQPDNWIAALGLAEAYQGMGDKGKAIEALERAKKINNDPKFKQEVDNNIKKLQ